jgi:hypothetical protein
MYNNEDFQNISVLNKGQIVIKLPGTDIIMPYNSGNTYINKTNTIGHITLNIEDFIVKSFDESKGELGKMGAELAKILEDPQSKIQLQEIISYSQLSIFYSKTENNREIITMPSLNQGKEIDETTCKDILIGIYSMTDKLPLWNIYSFHKKIISDTKLISNREMLEKEIQNLPEKTNNVYDKALDVIIKSNL